MKLVLHEFWFLILIKDRLMPPIFISPKRSLIEVEYGSSINITCNANGMPKPKIRWREGVCLIDSNF